MEKHDKKRYFLERVEDTAILQLHSDDFASLSKADRLKAYHFIQAALAGRDIYYDQHHRDALEVRNVLEEILLHPKGIGAALLAKVKSYAKLFWANSGQYNERTKKKFVPKFSFKELCKAARKAAGNGAKIPANDAGIPVEEHLKKLENVIFDPEYEPLITNKNPQGKDDVVTGSANNFYFGVTAADLEGFEEKHALNSRVAMQDGKVVEQVYRIGDKGKNVPAGLYARELGLMRESLQKALPYANATQKTAIRHLIRYFETGDAKEFDRYNIAWVKDDSKVDLILGFIEVYKDPRGQKGSLEGIVYCTDKKMTQLMKKVSQNAQLFEDRAPWDDRYKKRHVAVPTALAVAVLFGTGDGGPVLPLGINLPNSNILRQMYGSKSVLLTNVLAATNGVIDQKMTDEFVCNEARALLRKHSAEAENLHVALHEVLGHGSGKSSAKLKHDPAFYIKEYYSTLEEARADLMALHTMFDPKLVELGIMSCRDVACAEYWRYATADLTMLRRIKTDRIEDDHMRATHLIVAYIMDRFGAIGAVEEGGKVFFKVSDMARMHEGVKSLLSELMRIKAEGDYEAAKKLITKYSITFNKAWRDQVIRRADRIGLPEFFAFAMPEYVPVRNAKGKVVDAKIAYGRDFKAQMLKYSHGQRAPERK